MAQAIERLVLRGIKGIAQDEVFYINYGQAVTIGRMPSCDISYRNFKHFPTDATKEYTLNISREHVRIVFYNSQSVQIKDLSSNGTFVNGQSIRKIFISDIAQKSFEIKLGPTETFVLEADKGQG